ncbi:MAG: thiamine pyrophosphate-binding protein [Sciscionella sp.]
MGSTRDIADVLAAELRSAGVRRLFGLPGGGPNLDVVGAAADAGIDFVLAHDETAACIMAGTLGLLTGAIGAAIVTRGPGVTNAATGLAQATLDRFPLLLVSDTVSSTMASRVAHQRLDQQALSRPLTKWTGTLGRAAPELVVRGASELARRVPAGAVLLDFDAAAPGAAPPDLPPAATTSVAALARAREQLAGSRHPVVIAGPQAALTPGARDALAGLDCPMLCTYQGKGVVSDSSATSAGLFTNGTLERPLLRRADLILCVGVDPVEPIPAPWTYQAPVIMVSPVPVHGDYFGEPTVVVGPLEATLPQLLAVAEPRWEVNAGALARKRGIESLAYHGPGLSPHDVVREVMRAAPAASTFTVDAGAHMLVAMPLLNAERPHQVLISNGLATMGFALPSAIGAALSGPSEPVICIVGDGGLSMTLAELETLARLNLDVVVVVFNDASLSLIEIKQTEGQGGAGAVRYRGTDYAALARGMGVPGCAVESAAELRVRLSGGLRGPRLIDARIDPEGYRHVIQVSRG